MQRDVLTDLRAWKDSSSRKPLILRGARQVGKSWLAREVGREFETYAEVNFDRTPEVASLFEHSIAPDKLVPLLSNYLGVPIVAGKTLLFLDEIQNCPRALAALRYFYEEQPELHVLAAGSLLEFELQKVSVPVGRVSFLYVHPLSFAEYLTAEGKGALRGMLLDNGFEPLASAFHDQLMGLVRDYTLTGGMPQVVQSFLEHRNLQKCQEIQSDILQTYRYDFGKYARAHQVDYLQRVFDSIAFQSGAKFKYVSVSRDHKSRELSDALDLLCMAGVANRVHHSSANGTPLRAEVDIKRFKVTFFDVGLALRMLNVDHKAILLEPNIGRIRDGAIAELFTAQQFRAHGNPREEYFLHYWHREARSSIAEVDFVVMIDGDVVPIEVKSGSMGRMKSLRIFLEEKGARCGVKVSAHPFSRCGAVLSVPFYGLETLLTQRTSGIFLPAAI